MPPVSRGPGLNAGGPAVGENRFQAGQSLRKACGRGGFCTGFGKMGRIWGEPPQKQWSLG